MLLMADILSFQSYAPFAINFTLHCPNILALLQFLNSCNLGMHQQMKKKKWAVSL